MRSFNVAMTSSLSMTEFPPTKPSGEKQPRCRSIPIGTNPIGTHEDSEMTDLLEATKDGVAWLTLNRPDRLNVLPGDAAGSTGSATSLGRQCRGRSDGGHRGRTRLLRRRRRQDDGAASQPRFRGARRGAGANA